MEAVCELELNVDRGSRRCNRIRSISEMRIPISSTTNYFSFALPIPVQSHPSNSRQDSDHTHLRGQRADTPPVMRQIIGGRAVVLCWISQLVVAQVLPPLPVPTRPLEWGDVNFLSTSDTHGELVALTSQLHSALSSRLTASRLATGPSTCAHRYFAACSLLPVLMSPLPDHLARAGT